MLLLLLRQSLLLMGDRIVLFVCVENAGRSLMAEAIFNAHPPPGWRAISAGTAPAAAPNPRTGVVLGELGLPLPAHLPQPLTSEMIDRARIRVTMGCLDDVSCPAHLRSRDLRDWGLPDPAKLDVDGFRVVRDQLVTLVHGLRREIALSDRRAKTSSAGARSWTRRS